MCSAAWLRTRSIIISFTSFSFLLYHRQCQVSTLILPIYSHLICFSTRFCAEAAQQKGKPLFDYAAQAPNQISLKAGEIISIVNYGGKGSWSKGVEVATGMELIDYCCFITNFVSISLCRQSRILS
ncbi:hypothetical protein EON65_37190 [archaeon]|nr:MAG: hypothetical protein EON65_37190 [archaeon]